MRSARTDKVYRERGHPIPSIVFRLPSFLLLLLLSLLMGFAVVSFHTLSQAQVNDTMARRWSAIVNWVTWN